jgi:hypothetical protein
VTSRHGAGAVVEAGSQIDTQADSAVGGVGAVAPLREGPAMPSRDRARRARRARTWRRRTGAVALFVGVALVGTGAVILLGDGSSPNSPVDVQGETEVRTSTTVEVTRNTLERDSVDDTVVDNTGQRTADDPTVGPEADVLPPATTTVGPNSAQPTSPPVSVL